MKKLCSVVLCLLLLGSLMLPTFAAGEEPRITMQPQNYHYPEYSVAIYTVKATGSNLRATWYLQFEGNIYNLSDNYNGFEPWEAYAGENYGPMEDGPNTFSWFFGGIGTELNGAEIWCVIEDGHYEVVSERAVITVQGSAMPPEILDIPASVSVSRGSNGEIRCIAKSSGGEQLAFQWYETGSGKLWDIRAIDGEESDFLFCNTAVPGTRYYVCCVTSTAGGMVYSSVVPVTVTDSAPSPQGSAPTFLTTALPRGCVGQDYGFILKSDDPAAEFSIAYNPGGANDFAQTGLSLSVEGMLMGQPTKAGSYTFTVCVANAYGEDYGVLTLVVEEPAPTVAPTVPANPTASAPSEMPPETTPSAPPESVPDATKPPQPEVSAPDTTDAFPWWGYLLIVLGGVYTGIGIAFIFIKLKKKP